MHWNTKYNSAAIALRRIIKRRESKENAHVGRSRPVCFSGAFSIFSYVVRRFYILLLLWTESISTIQNSIELWIITLIWYTFLTIQQRLPNFIWDSKLQVRLGSFLRPRQLFDKLQYERLNMSSFDINPKGNPCHPPGYQNLNLEHGF